MDGTSPGDFLMVGDGLRIAATLSSLLLMVGGTILLVVRALAAHAGSKPLRIGLVFRMVAILGAMGGFIAYLRDQPLPRASSDLILGGLSATPWVSLLLLERIRIWRLGRKNCGS